MPSFYEFFAGGGLARGGLGKGWTCLFANDFDAKKGLTYQLNWGIGGELKLGDVGTIRIADVPGWADLVWGLFPCQDLSLAGGGAGLKGERSGTFYPFWTVVKDLIAEGRGPKLIALENVLGTLTSAIAHAPFEGVKMGRCLGLYFFGCGDIANMSQPSGDTAA